MEDIAQVRSEIDEIDGQIIGLFRQRMSCSDRIAAYKRERSLPVLDRARERQKVADACASVPEDLRDYTAVLMSLIMEVSRARQHAVMGTSGVVTDEVAAAVSSTPGLFPQQAFVACQGVEGAFSQIAADRLFKRPSISYFDNFEGVFRAVDSGFCDYGLLPVENSTAGSVTRVYDLMMEHDFHIVRTVRLRVDHALLAKPGCPMESIRDVYSHPQAIEQCAGFLESLAGVRVHACENTAAAAKMVAESDRDDVAALSSKSCADLYGLAVLRRDVQDSTNNYTRFACIAKDLQIFPGADRTSLMMVVNHEPGALYKVLARFYALDINLVKLESRPMPGRDFEFMFYFDIECPVAAPEFGTLMSSLDDVCEEFRYLGSYSEVV